MKLLSVLLVAAAAGVTSASYVEGNFIPNYRRDAHGPDGDAPKPPTPTKGMMMARQVPKASGMPKAGGGAPGALPSGLPKAGGKPPGGGSASGGMAGMSHGGMRARQAPAKPSGIPKAGGAPGALPSGLPKAGGKPPGGGSASGGMTGMGHGGMRARQAPAKPSGIPKAGGAPGGVPKAGAGGAMGGATGGGAPKGGSGHSHGGA